MQQHNVNLQRLSDGGKKQQAKLSQQSNQPELTQIAGQLDNHGIVSRLSQLHSNHMPSVQRTELVAQISHLHGNNSVQRLMAATANSNVIQRRVVCDLNNPDICWSEDDTLTSSSEPNMSYAPSVDASNGLDPISSSTSDPQLPSVDPATPPSAADNGWELFNNPIWNTVTNNTVSGATGLLENAWPGVYTLPTLTKGLMSIGGAKGLEMGLRLEDMLAAPASNAPGLLAPSTALNGMSRASAVLAPLGVVSNAMSLGNAISPSADKPVPSGLERIGEGGSSAAGLFSSSVGTASLAGAGLNALGASSALGGTALGGTLSTAGGALSTATGAAGLGPAAAVAGAGAGGYALGRLADEAAGGLMNVTGASDAIDRSRGISRPEGQHGDYSISGMTADHATSIDQGAISLLRSAGVLDESKPAYTQTLGWQLAELLPSWLQ